MGNRDTFIFFSDWEKCIDTMESQEDQLLMYKAISSYSLRGEDPDLPTHLVPLWIMIKSQIDRSVSNYDDIIEKRSIAGKKGMESRWKNKREKSVDDNKNNKDNNVINVKGVIETDNNKNNKDNYNKNKNKNKNKNEDLKSKDLKSLPPTPQGEPEAADAAEGGNSGFGIYLTRVAKALIEAPEVLEKLHMTTQYAWRVAEGMPGYALAVKKVIEEGGEPYEIEEKISAINKRYKTKVEFKIYKVAERIANQDNETWVAAVKEINRNINDPGIWDIMKEKMDYLEAHRKDIRNIYSFMQSRKNSNP